MIIGCIFYYSISDNKKEGIHGFVCRFCSADASSGLARLQQGALFFVLLLHSFLAGLLVSCDWGVVLLAWGVAGWVEFMKL